MKSRSFENKLRSRLEIRQHSLWSNLLLRALVRFQDSHASSKTFHADKQAEFGPSATWTNFGSWYSGFVFPYVSM
jgi:hypothetical protein